MYLLSGLIVIVFLALLAMLVEAVQVRRDTARFAPPGKIVAAGDARLHICCAGAGTPTVVLDAGLGDSSLVWELVQPEASRFTRVCSYDRAGLGWSEPGAEPRSAARMAEELHALLLQTGERGPYILVGHSAGVNTVRMFAHAYPDEVAGLVLIEPPLLSSAGPVLVLALIVTRAGLLVLSSLGGIRLLGRLSLTKLLFGRVQPPEALSDRVAFLYRSQAISASITEVKALPLTFQQMAESARPGAGDEWPVILLAAHNGDQPHTDQARRLERLASLFPNASIRYLRGSHFVHFEHPQAILDALRDLVSRPR